ncbi:hypothetical protein BOTBODRAFT_292577 [Botryobasidium botryosum FD-172 SS1]|uniref:Uncharacterized protein n=1 Tax=Botryobasidium botryosum (strain FD-172 SS1) TaxID=930990 RepID=A0A067MUC6_BOTB1|nr:hypothetical protein BOTBODRAFT_292577 [Botryobasidium botryosum FD-172 SS1]
MPEYVYGLHEFVPENEDEIAFRVGERIEVLEKDDLYGDGWWRGRNIKGDEGLFPKAYTKSVSPSAENSAAPLSISRPGLSNGPLQSLREENESIKTDTEDTGKPAAPETTVMAATMNDVQEAIEQLGVKRKNTDTSSRSISFASSRDDTDAETDHEDKNKTVGSFGGSHDEWHKDARKILAERASDLHDEQMLDRSAPPIPVEMSDESDADDDDEVYSVNHQQIGMAVSHDSPPSRGGRLPFLGVGAQPHEVLQPKDSPPLSSSPILQPSEPEPGEPEPENHEEASPDEPTSHPEPDPFFPTPIAAPAPLSATRSGFLSNGTPSIPPTPVTATQKSFAMPQLPPSSTVTSTYVSALPSPAAMSMPTPQTQRSITSQLAQPTPISPMMPMSPFSATSPSVLSSPSLPTSPAPPSVSADTQLRPFPSSQSPTIPPSNPSEWTVDQVVSWLGSKGFDQAICDKFIEHDISGDVLLELDAAILKEELGIPAFGKRMRLASAITELRRPMSSVASDISSLRHLDSPRATYTSHTRETTLASQPSAMSGPDSLKSPVDSWNPARSSPQSIVGPVTPAVTSPDTASSVLPSDNLDGLGGLDRMGGINGLDQQRMRRDSDPGAMSILSEKALATLGLGAAAVHNGKAKSSRPISLRLSPSETALQGSDSSPRPSWGRHYSSANGSGNYATPNGHEDRPVFSESETADGPNANTQKRRNMFNRRSIGSASTRSFSLDRDDPPPAVARPKKAGRESRGSERLSFLGTLGKSRKPAPRYSADPKDEAAKYPPEKSTRSLSRLYHLGQSATSPKRTPLKNTLTEAAVPRSESSGKTTTVGRAESGAAVLRKRTASAGEAVNHKKAASGGKTAEGGLDFRPGMTVMSQIGEPDYSGWIRKKGDRYNVWKSRFLVLKGPHLYYLKSDSTRIKGYINIFGYRVIADENADPGRYGFKLMHETEKMHLFSSDEKAIVREWMKALMKATIARDYTRPVISSCNIPTIPLNIAQAMNPPPRPPSPTQRAATQKAFRRENPNLLSTRDANVLKGMGGSITGSTESDLTATMRGSKDMLSPSGMDNGAAISSSTLSPAPPRPMQSQRRSGVSSSISSLPDSIAEAELLRWINTRIPETCPPANDLAESLSTGLILFRLAEAIKGVPAGVPDNAFPAANGEEKLEGLFKLFDFLLDNDVKTGSVSINDVRTGNREKIVQLVRSLKSWEDRRRSLIRASAKQAVSTGPWLGIS